MEAETEDVGRWIVPPWLRLATAARLLREKELSHLLVIDHGRVRSLPERDVLRRLLEDPRAALETVDALARSACTVERGTSWATAARLLGAQGGPDVLVVRDPRGEVVGVITPRSLLRAADGDVRNAART